MKSKKSVFQYRPAEFIPFRDLQAIERCRRIKKEDITRHPNPKFKISVIPDADVEFLWMPTCFTASRPPRIAGL